MAFVVRHHVKLIIKDKERQSKDTLDAINKQFEEQNKGMKDQMAECYNNLIEVVSESEKKARAEDEKIHKEIDIVRKGMLSIEGRAFISECRRLLEADHVITFDEYRKLQKEHTTYNDLGGNHDGDLLFEMVTTKYKKTVATADVEDFRYQ